MARPNDFHERQETARSAARKQMPKIRLCVRKLFYEYVNINPLVFLPRVFWASLPALYSPEEVFLIR